MAKKAGAQPASGQKTLFSFFARAQGAAAAPAKKPETATPAKSSSSSSPNVPRKQEEWEKLEIGSRVSVYWPNDKTYYNARVTAQKAGGSMFTLTYDDGEIERVDLEKEQFKILKDTDGKEEKEDNDKDLTPAPAKRRRINDDESEMEFDDEASATEEDDDDGSAYIDDPQVDDDDNEAQWMDLDDEDDEEVIQKPRKKRLQVTKHVSSATKKTSPRNNPYIKSSSFETPKGTITSNPFDAYKSGGSSTKSNKVTPPATTPAAREVTPDSSSSTHSPLPFQYGVVNPAGSHAHNHCKFLQQPRDADGRSPGDPLYNPKTLKVDYRELDRVQGTKSKTSPPKISPAAKQWWEIKSQYFDTVLFFKTGKFYEMFHMDADIGVKVLDFIYMKGHVAHAGFPEISYGVMAERLVRAGYKVARVEQTETPDALKERKKRKTSGPTPKVVNREVCSILTSGTRTFCYLDDTNGLMNSAAGNSSNNGPLLAIREIVMEASSQQDADSGEVQPVCEYGVTMVDAVRATVTIGQFADDVLRSRMNTLLTTFSPSEILVEGGESVASPTLMSLLKSFSNKGTRVEQIHTKESFPKSTAIDPNIRRTMERTSSTVRPWDADETLEELHRRGYYPRGSRQSSSRDTSRWPSVLRAAVEGKAELCLSSFGAALFYLQRGLVDHDILGMGIVKAYVPPTGVTSATENRAPQLMQAVREQQRTEDGMDVDQSGDSLSAQVSDSNSQGMEFEGVGGSVDESQIDHLALDGTTLQNLEILFNAHSHTAAGSLWSKINFTKSPHGSRLLRAWLLRPLFRKADIDRRADAVEELVSGAAAMSMNEARGVLAKCGDIERLLSRVHSMGGATHNEESSRCHPNERAVLYEASSHTKRKVGDFSRVLNGLRSAAQIPELFEGVDLQSGLLQKIVRSSDNGGCFPIMMQELDWFFDNFDCEQAAKGLFEPSRGIDESYDEACDTIERIKRELEDYKDEMCSEVLRPSHVARSKWKYINTKDDSKDKYLIELPMQVKVPHDFVVKGKRGKGDKQINKYRTPDVERLVAELEHAIDIQKAGKAKGMKLVFAKFDSMRNLWAAAARATAMLDALGSLAQAATQPGFTRPKILDCPPDATPCIKVIQGRHPCVDHTHTGGDFIPNDLALGNDGSQGHERDCSRVLLLSGPNMGGKSTLLRQTCLIAILAQVGCYVPAEECVLTPVDRIFTRLGATDRILVGQSTFFVELAETAAALRGATRRSIVCMDELGRGTSTFDGTAIAYGAVKSLVERNRCLSLFATHYHSLLTDWEDNPSVRLGHMECIVDGSGAEEVLEQDSSVTNEEESDKNITFLYTLGNGVCPKSFGINVARLAHLPDEVLARAKRVSSDFEAKMNGMVRGAPKVTPNNAHLLSERLQRAFMRDDLSEFGMICEELNG